MAKQQQKATTTTKRTAGEEDVKLRRMTTQAAASAITHASSRNIPAAAPSARRTTTATTNTATTSTIAQRDISYLYSSLFAGMSSGAVSAFVCAPLDLVRTRLQVWGDVAGGSRRLAVWTMFRDIVAADGVKGCFRGLTATLLTVPAFWGVYCTFYFWFAFLRFVRSF